MPQAEEHANSGLKSSSVPGNNDIPPGTDDGNNTQGATDWRLRCWVMAVRVLGLPADYDQLVRAYPPSEYPDLRLLRTAKSLDLGVV
jgi:hypothetical protein